MEHAQGLPEHLLAHSDFVRALAWHLLRDEQAAEDVVQETWLSALRHPPQDHGTLRAWLARVTRNHVFQRRRAHLRRAEHEANLVERDRAPSTAEIFEREAARKSVVDAVVDLHEPYRSTILLRFYEDLPLREVARRLDIPLETVRTRQKRGLELLRQKLDREYDGERSNWSVALLPLVATHPAPVASGAGTTAALAASIAAVLMRFKLLWSGALAMLLLWGVWAAAVRVPEHLEPALPSAFDSLATGDRFTDAPALRAPDSAGARAEAPVRRSGKAPEREQRAAVPRAPSATSVRGRVLGEDELAISGARVLAFTTLRPRIVGGRPVDAVAETRTDASGAFELHDLPQTIFLHAIHGDFVADAGLAAALTAPADLTGIELHVLPALEFSGRVLDPEGGAVGGAAVKVKSHDRRGRGRSAGIAGASYRALIEHETTTAPDGSFRIAGVPRSPHVITILRSGFLVEARELETTSATIDFTLARGMALRVQVRDSRAEPVAGATVFVSALRVPVTTARTDEQGWAEFSPMPRSGFAGARVEARGHATLLSPPIELLPGHPEVVLTLAEPRSIDGEVVDDDGRPMAGANVAALFVLPDEAPWNGVVVRKLDASLVIENALTDAQGHFAFTSLCDGAFDLQVSPPGALRPEAFAKSRAGESGVRIVVGARGPDAVVFRGRVTDALAGSPVGAYSISAYEDSPNPARPPQMRTVESVDGAYELRVPSRGAWRLAVRAVGFAPWISPARAYDEAEIHLDVALLPERDLRVRLLDQRGERVRRARVICRDTDGEPVATQISADYWLDSVPVGPDGEVLLAKLPATIVMIEVRLPDLQELEPFRVDLREPRAETFEIVVPLDLGAPRREVLLEVKEAMAGTDEESPLEGRFLVEVFDAHGLLCASFAARYEGGLCAFVKPLDYQILRYLDAGPLRDRSIEHAERDPLGGDQIAMIPDPSLPVFRVPLPMGPGRIRVSAEGRAPAEAVLPPVGPADPVRRVAVRLVRTR